MPTEKPIPLAKAYEAYSALADRRIYELGKGSFGVWSSDRSKAYTVVDEGDGVYSSNDNATYWQHYAGYPVLAVLAFKGKIRVDESIFPYFKGIDWKKINQSVRNDYGKAIALAFGKIPDNVRAELAVAAQRLIDQATGIIASVKGNRAKLIHASLDWPATKRKE